MKASWDDHRFFLAVARARSMTGAAKALSVTQPTVSRRLEAMEAGLGVRLFTRTRKGYELTPSGAELFETVIRVEEELLQADRNLMGRDQEISGSLRFTSTEIFVNGYLGPHLWAFLRDHPDIELHLTCTQSLLSIGRGEADIAVRFTEKPPETLVGKRLGTVAYAIYGARGAVGDAFRGRAHDDLPWIGMFNESHNRLLYGTFLPSTRPKHRVDSMNAMHAMVREGLGVSILPCYTADLDPTLERIVAKPLIDPKFDIWMLYHRDTRHTGRLRLFADFLAGRLKKDLALFEGRQGTNRPTDQSLS
ncbi:MAG: LysR family transcriptional regulator [Arenibacterium sp.]